MFGRNYETAYICIVFSCRDDNAYSLVKSSLVFVLVLVLRCEHQNFLCTQNQYCLCNIAIPHPLYAFPTGIDASIPAHTIPTAERGAIRDDRVRRAGWSWHGKAVRQRTAAPSDG